MQRREAFRLELLYQKALDNTSPCSVWPVRRADCAGHNPLRTGEGEVVVLRRG